MDLPWNPAVLEQRIGRVHRLGQKTAGARRQLRGPGHHRGRHAGVLKFKKSLFAGVLDGGEKEVFLGGSRLNKFMETVESATAAIPEAMLEDAEDALRAPPDELAGPGRSVKEAARDGAGRSAGPRRRGRRAGGRSAPQRPAAADPWAGLIQTGMALLQQFVAAAQQGNRPAIQAPGSATPLADTRGIVHAWPATPGSR